MKNLQQIEKWLHGTLRAWLITNNKELEMQLSAEAVTLIWVMNDDTTWAMARETFEAMIEDLRVEMNGA